MDDERASTSGLQNTTRLNRASDWSTDSSDDDADDDNLLPRKYMQSCVSVVRRRRSK